MLTRMLTPPPAQPEGGLPNTGSGTLAGSPTTEGLLMRLITRAISGLLIASVTLALLGFAGWRIQSAVLAGKPNPTTPVREREFTVETATFQPRDVTPVLTAYGRVHAWSILEIRSAAAGPITEIGGNFRDGRIVESGELLFRVDPEVTQRRVMDAETALVQAKSELTETKASLVYLKSDEKAAQNLLMFRKADQGRKQKLRDKEILSAAALDSSNMEVSFAEQALAAKQKAVLSGEAALERAQKKFERAEVALRDAERALKSTTYQAPFAGRLSGVSTSMGRQVGQNEKLADLIDPQAPDRVLPLPIKARLDLQGRVVEVDGILDRSAPTVGSDQGGRTVFARLQGAQLSALRPGDYVTVEVSESPIQGVALVPPSAATEDGWMLVVGDDERLSETRVKIERRQGDDLIVSGFPAGKSFATVRMPYLGPGTKVKRRSTDPAPPVPQPKDEEPAVADAQQHVPGEVALSDDDRDALIKHVRASSKMAEDYRRDTLQELSKAKPPRELVDQLQRQIAHGEERL